MCTEGIVSQFSDKESSCCGIKYRKSIFKKLQKVSRLLS